MRQQKAMFLSFSKTFALESDQRQILGSGLLSRDNSKNRKGHRRHLVIQAYSVSAILDIYNLVGYETDRV